MFVSCLVHSTSSAWFGLDGAVCSVQEYLFILLYLLYEYYGDTLVHYLFIIIYRTHTKFKKIFLHNKM